MPRCRAVPARLLQNPQVLPGRLHHCGKHPMPRRNLGRHLAAHQQRLQPHRAPLQLPQPLHVEPSQRLSSLLEQLA